MSSFLSRPTPEQGRADHMRGAGDSVRSVTAHVLSMENITVAMPQDLETITPVHIIVAVVVNVIWVGLMLRDRRRRLQTERDQKPE
jgi:hypothetical protein